MKYGNYWSLGDQLDQQQAERVKAALAHTRQSWRSWNAATLHHGGRLSRKCGGSWIRSIRHGRACRRQRSTGRR